MSIAAKFRRLLAPGLLFALLVSAATPGADAQTAGSRGIARVIAGKLTPGTGGDARIFALVAGVDDYQYVPKLNGAVADAQDIARSLRNDGVTQITTLLNGAVTRAAITQAMTDIIAQARAGDLVIITFAGHGSQEPAKVVTKDNSGLDEVFILAGFDEDGPPLAERLLDKEIFNWLSQLDAKGVSVVFLADTCHGGGLSKTVDPRIGHLSYRALRYVKTRAEANPAAGTYTIAQDPLQAETAQLPEAPATDDLKRLTFLAAVDKWHETPEIMVPPEPTPRGAVSYAFARALEGKADLDHDGRITRRELISYMRDKTRDLTERGQEPEFAPLARLDDVVFNLGGATQVATAHDFAVDARPPAPDAEIKVGVLNGAVPDKDAVGRTTTPFSLAATDGKAPGFDAVWDAANGDVVSSLGDIVARRVQRSELSGVVDRLAAIRQLAVLAHSAQSHPSLTPNKHTYRANEIARLQVDGVDGRYLIVANISGNGKIQFVYPIQGDEPLVVAAHPGDPKVIGDIYIKPPFGSEAVVAVASKERLPALEELLIRRSDQQGAREFVDALAQLPPGAAEISFLSFFTEP